MCVLLFILALPIILTIGMIWLVGAAIYYAANFALWCWRSTPRRPKELL